MYIKNMYIKNMYIRKLLSKVLLIVSMQSERKSASKIHFTEIVNVKLMRL